MHCCLFLKEEKTIITPTCRRKLVSYDFSKYIVIIANKSDALKNVPDKVKRLIHAIDNHPSGCKMTFNINLPYVVHTLKKIHFNSNLFDEFSTKV